MLLDREENGNGKGKYALIKLREITLDPGPLGTTFSRLVDAIRDNPDYVDFGLDGSDSEFFVIRLKDKYAVAALEAYAKAAMKDDPAWGMSVQSLAEKAKAHPGKKMPD